MKKNALSSIFPFLRRKTAPDSAGTPPAGDLLRCQSELQAMRITLVEYEQRVILLENDRSRLQIRQEQMLAERVQANMQEMIGAMAAPASQITTQMDLAERQGKTLQAQDVLLVARRLIRALERQGMVLEGTIGAQVPFDPNRHTLLTQGSMPPDGTPMTIRFAGVSYQGMVLYKALVE